MLILEPFEAASLLAPKPTIKVLRDDLVVLEAKFLGEPVRNNRDENGNIFGQDLCRLKDRAHGGDDDRTSNNRKTCLRHHISKQFIAWAAIRTLSSIMSRFTKSPHYDLICPQVGVICSRARLGITLVPGHCLVGAGIFLVAVLAPHNLLTWRTFALPLLLCFPGLLFFLSGFLSWISVSKEMRYWLLIHFFFFLLDVIVIVLVGCVCKYVSAANFNSEACSSWVDMSNSTRAAIERDFDCCGCIPRNASMSANGPDFPEERLQCSDPRQPSCELAIDSRLNKYLYTFGDIAFVLAGLLTAFIFWALFAIRSALSHRQAEQDRFLSRSANRLSPISIDSVHSASIASFPLRR